MSKLKINIWLNIVIISISIFTIVTGVYSIFSAKLTITGSIGYVAPEPEYYAICSITGATNGVNSGTLYATNNTTSTTKDKVKMDKDGYVTFGNLDFASSSDTITFNINITNDSSEAIAVDIDFESLNLTGITRTVSTDYLQIIRPSSYTGTIADNDASIKSSESASIFTFTFTKISGSTPSISGNLKINIQPVEQILLTSGYTFSRGTSGSTCAIEDLPVCDETTNPTKTITIPSYFYDSDNDRYLKVTGIDADGVGMSNGSGYTKFIFCNGIKSIGIAAFKPSTIFDLIILPSSLESIGVRAFMGCSSLTSITIPSGVVIISRAVFYNCSGLTSITIPSSVTSIGDNSFYNCSSLTGITIPSSVTSIGPNAFSNTPFLTNLKSESDGIYTCSDGKKIMIEASSTDITSAPDLTGVYLIADSAFYGCSKLTNITIPSSVTSIGSSAFYNCSSLTSVTFADTSKGWTVVYASNTSKTYIVSVDNPETNAKYLTSTYSFYTWTKNS